MIYLFFFQIFFNIIEKFKFKLKNIEIFSKIQRKFKLHCVKGLIGESRQPPYFSRRREPRKGFGEIKCVHDHSEKNR